MMHVVTAHRQRGRHRYGALLHPWSVASAAGAAPLARRVARDASSSQHVVFLHGRAPQQPVALQAGAVSALAICIASCSVGRASYTHTAMVQAFRSARFAQPTSLAAGFISAARCATAHAELPVSAAQLLTMLSHPQFWSHPEMAKVLTPCEGVKEAVSVLPSTVHPLHIALRVSSARCSS